MNDPVSEARTLLRTVGVPLPAAELYLKLLRAGALKLSVISDQMSLSPAAVTGAVDYLKLFRLISQDVEDGEIVLFASNPRNAWKAHDTQFYWARSLHVGDIEAMPPLPEMRDEERRRYYARLEKLCGSVYDANARAYDPLRRRHREIYSAELFSTWLATAIASASAEIIAVELPPRLPDLAPIWVALTRRLRAGTTYTRIVGIDELAEHGLAIVLRDMDEYGIHLRIAHAGVIDDAFYLVDGKRLLLKNNRAMVGREGSVHFGVYTSHYAIARRYRDLFVRKYLPASDDARPIVEALLRKVDAACDDLKEEGLEDEASVLRDIACSGKFAKVDGGKREVVQRLVARGAIERNGSGHLVMNFDSV